MARYGRYHLGIGGVPVLRRRSILGRPGSENAARRRTVGVPEKKTARPARKTKSPSTQAGEYVREEVEHVRGGKHGARSAKQVIAIGLSKARRAGVMFTPARLALDSPMAITCLAERAPCLPPRTCSTSSRTYSPACVEGDLVFRAGRAVFFSGTPTVRRRAAFSLPGLPNMERRRSTGTPPIPRWYRPYRAICFCQNQEPSPVLSCPRPG